MSLANISTNNNNNNNNSPQPKLECVNNHNINTENTPIKSERLHVLLCVTGSVATIKIYELAIAIKEFADIRIVTTDKAKYFYDLHKLSSICEVYEDKHEWNSNNNNSNTMNTDNKNKNASNGYKRGDAVLHIELRKWANLLIIAPLSANTLAKIANGLSDNLLTCIIRAWDYSNIIKKPILVAPAMNTAMYNNVFTSKHLQILISLGIKIIDPIEKLLACGDIGIGAMASVDTIVQHVKSTIASMNDAVVTNNSIVDSSSLAKSTVNITERNEYLLT